jgi:demethylmenaquinone methyltransferase / 2-methoxy-6-polyprenyl-1,4-benzoquinol methylase
MTERDGSPLAGRAKEEFVERMFSSIAPRYDLLNSVISLNRHRAWRRFAVQASHAKPGDFALDVAAGTGDFSFDLAQAVGAEGSVIASDFCEPMIDIGVKKTQVRGLTNVSWALANAMELPFSSNTFDCAVIGFGLRNVASVPQAVAEMTRVIKPGGRVLSLEINKPASMMFKPLWMLYFYGLLPSFARIFGGKREAYTYLPDSVKRFHSRQELSQIMLDAGLVDIQVHDLTMGVVCVHVGVKP